MIDEPKGRGEELLECVFVHCRKLHDRLKGLAGRNPRRIKIAAAICCAAVFSFMVVGYAMPREVTVYMDDSLTTVSTMYETTAKQVDRFLDGHDIDYIAEQDEIDVQMEDPIEDGMEIHIRKAFDVTIEADGGETTVTILPMTVEEALAEAEITYDDNDIIEPSLQTRLKKGSQITVKRVTVAEESRIVEVDYQTVEQADSSIAIGDVQVTQKGRKGKIRETFSITYVDGEETERELVKSETLKKKRNKIISYGTKISSGKPSGLQYQRKIENVRAVSYYFRGNPSGSYGLPCTYGTVAVDPKVIPLGSKLYIEGYGYAIANDVGSAIKGKTVDLYMERFEQCMLWGARWTTVYIIDEA
ncbi:MAG: 3D domain-containing protein [Anaerovoracaceae bacterium]